MHSNNFSLGVLVGTRNNYRSLSERLDGEVHAPFGSQYGLSLRNNNGRRAKVTISIDGVNVSGSGGYLLEAYGSVDLWRFHDVDRAFRLASPNSAAAASEGKDGPNYGQQGVIVANFTLETPPRQPTYYRDGSKGVMRGGAMNYDPTLESMGSSQQDMRGSVTRGGVRGQSAGETAVTTHGNMTGQGFTTINEHITWESGVTSIRLVLKGIAEEVVAPLLPATPGTHPTGGYSAPPSKYCTACGRVQGIGDRFCPNDGTPYQG